MQIYSDKGGTQSVPLRALSYADFGKSGAPSGFTFTLAKNQAAVGSVVKVTIDAPTKLGYDILVMSAYTGGQSANYWPILVVNDSSAALSFHAPKTIALALRIPKRDNIQLTVLDATPPAKLSDGRILLPPNGESTVVEFELEGPTDEMLRVEVFHPDAVEDVEPKVVEGFFEVFRNRRSQKARDVEPSPVAPSTVQRAQPSSDHAEPASAPGPAGDWKSLIEDAGFRDVLVYIQQHRTMNEAELGQTLGSARRVRAFSREFDNLMSRVPFSVEIAIVSGLKTYVRKD